jgi:hypothetical protein
MTQTVIEKANKIARNLHSDLLKTGAIDAQGNVIKSQMFIDIIEHAESELNKLIPEVENEAGITTNRNGANILYNYISIFNEMKETMSVHPEINRVPEEEHITQVTSTKTPKTFQSGIKNILSKIKSKFIQTPEKTETR